MDGRLPVDVDAGVVVEKAGEGAADELAEGVAQQPGLVQEVPGRLVPAFGDQLVGGVVQQLPQLRDGDLLQARMSVAVPGQVLQGALDNNLVGGPERNPSLSDALASDEAADQGQPATENDGCATLGLCCGQVLPARSERAESERVDPGGQAVPDREWFHTQGAA